MKHSYQTLYLEINNENFIFFVGECDEQNNFKITYKFDVPIIGIENNRISDLEKAFNLIKENIYFIEQKLNFTFKEIVLILENFNPTFINLSGYKSLNGSQILRENITYILNTLKSYVDKIEAKKTVLHIFNSNFLLDNKKIENLPIGLFGDFYSHELSLILININDYKNLKNIFDKSNLKIKKILLKSFIKGAYISDNNLNTETFFLIEINNKNSNIFYFENNSLKFEQTFKFGFEIIINDVCKITSLKKDTVQMILEKIELNEKIPDDELLEERFFNKEKFRKIKKKLIYQIVLARIKEISDIMINKNINLNYYNKFVKVIFFQLNCELQPKRLKEIYRTNFSIDSKFKIFFLDNLSSDKMLKTLNKLVHFGWKKEAIPITTPKKSIIARFFDAIFS